MNPRGSRLNRRDLFLLILFELTGDEQHASYRQLEISNAERHYGFLQSIVKTSIDMQRPFLSQTILKALNFHAIACLHTNAGEFRPCEVKVGNYKPPAAYQVSALMDDFVNYVNRMWETSDAIFMAAFVLWRLNYIHPFINGNGRTARAACYYVICVANGGLLPGTKLLPTLLKENRPALVKSLKAADASIVETGNLNLTELHGLISALLLEQLKTAPAAKDAPNEDGA